MDFKVVFSGTFVDDLAIIVRSIAIHNPYAAQRLGEKIIAMSERLNFFPERHPALRRRPHIRRFIVNKYFKVFYYVSREEKTVEILRCWDGRRETDPPSFG